jgi:hypothetical protein
MKPIIIKAGQPIKFIGTIPNETIIVKAGNSRAVPETKYEIFKGKKYETKSTNIQFAKP